MSSSQAIVNWLNALDQPDFSLWVWYDINIQISPEGEVNSGRYVQRRESVEVYSHRSSLTLRGIVVLVFTKSDR